MDPKELARFFRPPAWATGHISLEDASFLDQMVRLCEPSDVIELGVASGCSSALLLRSLAEVGKAGSLHSFDVADHCYFDSSKPVGAAVSELVPELESEWALHTGCMAIDAAAKFAGKAVPLAFIDADHRHPWPALDLWALLPALRPCGWVALHDIALARVTNWKIYGPEILFSYWPGEKLSSEGRGNIGAVRLPESEEQARRWLLDVLQREWEAEVDAATLDRLGIPVEARQEIAKRSLPEGLDQKLADLRMQGRELVVWGAGESGRLCLDLLVDGGIRPDAFVDRDKEKQNRLINGLPVWSIETLRKRELQPFVLIASTFEAEISRELCGYGFRESSDYTCFRFDATFGRPEERASIEDKTPPLLGMTTAEEQAFLFKYASKKYSNAGAIVDLGSWLGSTTIPLARGLEAAGIAKDRCVQAYDTFIWQTWMDPYAEGLTTRFRAGDSFLVEFQRRLGRCSARVRSCPGDLREMAWGGEAIEFLLVDAMKSWQLCSAINRRFLTAVIPGEGLFMHQDFKFWRSSWIHLTMYRMREIWEIEQDLPNSTGTVFRLLQTPSESLLAGQCGPAFFDRGDVEAAYGFWQSRLAGPFTINLRYARLLALVEIGEIEAAMSGFVVLIEEDLIPPEPFRALMATRAPQLKSLLAELEPWEDSMRRAAAAGRRIWVWGGGSGGANLLRRHPVLRSLAAGVIDSDSGKVGKLVAGLPVSAPESVLAQEDSRPFVVVATSFATEVGRALRERGWVRQRDYCLGCLP